MSRNNNSYHATVGYICTLVSHLFNYNVYTETHWENGWVRTFLVTYKECKNTDKKGNPCCYKEKVHVELLHEYYEEEVRIESKDDYG